MGTDSSGGGKPSERFVIVLPATAVILRHHTRDRQSLSCRPSAMATQKLGGITGGEQELCLADKLSDWLVCGVIILDARQRIESVTEEAQQILGSSAAQ